MKRAAAERERAMEAADEAPVMSTVQMAQLKSLIAEVGVIHLRARDATAAR